MLQPETMGSFFNGVEMSMKGIENQSREHTFVTVMKINRERMTILKTAHKGQLPYFNIAIFKFNLAILITNG